MYGDSRAAAWTPGSCLLFLNGSGGAFTAVPLGWQTKLTSDEQQQRHVLRLQRLNLLHMAGAGPHQRVVCSPPGLPVDYY